MEHTQEPFLLFNAKSTDLIIKLNYSLKTLNNNNTTQTNTNALLNSLLQSCALIKLSLQSHSIIKLYFNINPLKLWTIKPMQLNHYIQQKFKIHFFLNLEELNRSNINHFFHQFTSHTNILNKDTILNTPPSNQTIKQFLLALNNLYHTKQIDQTLLMHLNNATIDIILEIQAINDTKISIQILLNQFEDNLTYFQLANSKSSKPLSIHFINYICAIINAYMITWTINLINHNYY